MSARSSSMRWPYAAAAILTVVGPVGAFAHPAAGIVINRQDEIFFADFVHSRIMKVSSDGALSVFVEDKDRREFPVPHHLTLDAAGNLFTVGDGDGKVQKITPQAQVVQIYPPKDWYGIDFIGTGGDPFTIDAEGNIYCVNYRQWRHCQILKITPEGRIVSLAGGAWGHADGKGDKAKFRDLHGSTIVCGPDGTLYLTDGGTAVRKVARDGDVATLAGGPESGCADGKGAAAKFNGAGGLACDTHGNVWVADTENRRIRKISPDGTVLTVAARGTSELEAEKAGQTPFERPVGVAVGGTGNLYVLDYGRDECDVRIHRINPNGLVTTLCTIRK